ncbi:MAG: hypothetical protein RSE07_04215 [Oscillospiraceae bacterium]
MNKFTPIPMVLKPSLKKLVEVKKEKKINIFFKNIITALETMGQLNKLYYLVLVSFMLIVVGIFTGITFGNIYLAIIFGIILAMIPFFFVRSQYIDYKDLLLDEMETGLSVITSSVERTDNILDAFKENLPNIRKPLNDVFTQFIYAVEHNVPITDAIDTMKSKINNSIFVDWCDALKNTSRNRTLKYSLRPIVYRIGDIKTATNDAKTILFECNNEFKGVSKLSIIFMIVSYFIGPKMLQSLNIIVPQQAINILLAIDVLILFVFSVRTFLLTRDINFEEEY